jgi:uncharacterized protein YlxW (UPF0749 family)
MYTQTVQQYSTHVHTNSTQKTQNGTYIIIKKIETNLGSTSYTLAFALKLRKNHGKPSVKAAARTTQADAVQYKNNEQYNTQKKNSNTEQCNATAQYRTQNTQQRENSPYQLSKPCVKLCKKL